MSSLNRAMIIGRLGADPELRYTKEGRPVCNINVATSEAWNDEKGGKKEDTQWHRINIWGKQAENCAKYLAKGKLVFVEGRIQTRSWQDQKSNEKRYATEILAQNVRFLGPTSERAATSNEIVPPEPASQAGSGSFSLEDIPF